jgi:hypothetical protein
MKAATQSGTHGARHILGVRCDEPDLPDPHPEAFGGRFSLSSVFKHFGVRSSGTLSAILHNGA